MTKAQFKQEIVKIAKSTAKKEGLNDIETHRHVHECLKYVGLEPMKQIYRPT